MAAYDRNSHFTISAFKKLEVVAEIPVLTGNHFVESKLSGIKRFAGFSLYSSAVDAYPANVILYMESWLRRYEESKGSIAPPSWGKFLEALQLVKLVDLREKIENCLKTASEVVEGEIYEGIIIILHVKFIYNVVLAKFYTTYSYLDNLVAN